ncbi:MerR family transcriptional regulator [Paenibacillus athensensis]|uniref:MerR family transcriptional regulator n=1 Tax=Paenibacillus athensensis TaxID=1967502 RepID=A0A4Y8Q3W1_9BACL|nr:MerR family transcriptional regulator [Paenibacillus athensensis]MCD1258424.1 MerR family transcriptional regulator [Paenibacillus athensensis]
MKIQELAQRAGLSVHTIRYYEKEGLLNSRHVQRDNNNYRSYTTEAHERLKLIKKFQGIGCSLTELKDVLKDHDEQTRSNEEIIAWIRRKIGEIERKKAEYDHMLGTLNWMLTYRQRLIDDPEQAREMLASLTETHR